MMANTVKFGDSENCFTHSEYDDKSDWVLTLNTVHQEVDFVAPC